MRVSTFRQWVYLAVYTPWLPIAKHQKDNYRADIAHVSAVGRLTNNTVALRHHFQSIVCQTSCLNNRNIFGVAGSRTPKRHTYYKIDQRGPNRWIFVFRMEFFLKKKKGNRIEARNFDGGSRILNEYCAVQHYYCTEIRTIVIYVISQNSYRHIG